MIKYKFDEELEYAKHYAHKLEDQKALKILELGEVKDSTDALYLSEFFWKMVESSIEDEKREVKLPWVEGAEFWNEKIMISLSGYLERAGYENEWEKIVDQQ